MRAYFLFFFTFLFFFSSIQAQSSFNEKEYAFLQNEIRRLTNTNVDSAFIVAERLEKSKSDSQKAFAIGAKSYLYQIKGDSFKSKQAYEKASKILSKLPWSFGNKQLKAFLLNYGGLSDWKRGDLSSALEKYNQGKKISISIDDKIQIQKFNGNIALVNCEAENFKSAIKATKEVENFLENNRKLYNEEQYSLYKSNNNMNLGMYYEKYYLKNNKEDAYLLDSAFYYYKKSLNFSKNILVNKVKAQKNIGDIYFLKHNFKEAEKAFQNALIISKENNLQSEYYNSSYNLGFLNYSSKNYDKALLCFQKVDSIYNSTESNLTEFVNSNYYQAKIYDIYGDSEKASLCSKIYLDNFEKNEVAINNEILEINSQKSAEDFKKEMLFLQKENKNKFLLRRGLVIFLGLFLLVILGLYFRSNRDRKKAERRIEIIISENKMQAKELTHIQVQEEVSVLSEIEKQKNDLSISENSEKEIMSKLKLLEERLFYLKPDFNQQEVAKKIKTNTTYLSYVVNKNYNKSFSVYYNELRINYAINEIINNKKYREYTTQAIAESVGFKNADSFANSFKKKTGVTPYQFIKEIKKRELI